MQCLMALWNMQTIPPPEPHGGPGWPEIRNQLEKVGKLASGQFACSFLVAINSSQRASLQNAPSLDERFRFDARSGPRALLLSGVA